MSLNPERDRLLLSPARRALLDAWIRAGASGTTATIPPRSDGEPIPLSFAQERLWFLNQFAPDVPVNNLGFAVRMQGPILIETLEYVLGEVFRRHEAMRTIFPIVDARPVQRVSPFAPVHLSIVDVPAGPDSARRSAIDRLTTALLREPFDLVNGPVWRATVLRLDEMDLVLAVTFHHIAADARSVTLLKRELDVIASAFLNGAAPALPPLPVQYPDFAAWQRSAVQDPVLEADLAYWTERLRAMPPVLELPADRPRPARQTYAGAGYRFDLPEDLIAGLRELSRRQGATLFMTLLTAFTALLHRYTGATDLAVGTPVSGRNWPEVEPLIGLFVNTLVMRTDCSGDPTFGELIGRVASGARAAYAHQTLPFEQLVDKLAPHRDLSRMPLVQVMFNLRDDEGAPELRYGPLTTIRLPRLFPGTAVYDLAFDLVDGHRGAFVEYSTALFDESTIARMTTHYQALLASAVRNPNQRISRLAMLTESEGRQLVVDWNPPAGAADPCTLSDRWALQVAASPDAPALEADGARLTYGELDARADAVAAELRRMGVGPEVPVAVCVERSAASVIALLAVLKAGGVFTPIDVDDPDQRVTYVVRNAGSRVLLTSSSNAQRMRAFDLPLIAIDEAAPPAAPMQPVVMHPGNLAYIIYTSGSTGEPKGVGVTHAAAAAHLQAAAAAYQLGPGDRVLQFASIAFDAAIEQVLTALLSGACLVLRGRDPWDPAEFQERVRELDLTVANLPTPFWNQIPLDGAARNAAFRLRLVIAGGDVMSPRTAARWSAGPLGQARLLNAYGPTEATITSTLHEVSKAGKDPEPAVSIPIGHGLGDRTLYVLDGSGELVPVGVPGELHLGGPLLARAYLGLPELTAARFIPDRFGARPGARLYRTGDLVRYRSDGCLEYLGRRDGQVKLRGFRVELDEVTAALARHPGVKECLTVVRPDGSGDRQMVAYVVATADAQLEVGDLRHFLQERLPRFMVPSIFITLASLPRTTTGKVDRHALPEPDPQRREPATASVRPRTPTEEVVAGIWGEVLKLETLSVHENFFDLGGHSLLATQVIARMRETFQVDVTLRRLFEAPTIAEQAADVDREMSGAVAAPDAVVRTSGATEIPLSFAQQRLWFLDQWLPDDPFYNIPVPLRLAGPLEATALEWALNEVVRRHDVLRASFPSVDGRAVQVIAPTLTLSLPLVDLSALGDSEQRNEAHRLAEDEGRQRFELASGPLLRALLVRLAPEEHLLLLTLHHIVADGWSMAIVVRELSELYAAAHDDRPSSLPELSVQYTDFALWQHRTLDGERRDRLMAYWIDQLGGALPALELPHDRPRPLVQRYADAHRPFALPPALVDRLKALSRRNRVTTFMTLLAAFQVLISRYTSERDILLGTTVGGRDQRQLEALIGCFVNTLVLRTDLSGNPSFAELLQRVREVALGAYAHQELPFEQLVEVLQPDRDLSRTPLFQVMFAFQNMPPEPIESARLQINPIALDASPARCDLTLVMRDSGATGSFEYDGDLFDGPTIDRMAANFQVLLEGLVADPNLGIDDVELVAKDERDAMLDRFNTAPSISPPAAATHQLFEARAAAMPAATALQWSGGSLTYQELDTRANQLAHALRRLGAQPETIVGLYLPRSPEMVIGLLAALKAGAAYLPLDPSAPLERLTYMLDDSGAQIVLTHSALRERLGTREASVIALDDEWPAMAAGERPFPQVETKNLAYVIYTSGSTGRPKGTLLTHEGLVNYVSWAIGAYALDQGKGAPVHSPLGFDLTITSLLVPLAAGQTVTLIDETAGIDGLVESLRAGPNFNLVKLTPAHLEVLGRQLSPAQASHCARFMVIGGENLSAETTAFWREHAPHTTLVNEYGPTETVVGCCVYTVPADLPASVTAVPIGRPIQNTQLYVLDERMRPVPVGVSGELFIGGLGLARGYLNRPDLTAERFLPHPFCRQPGERLYRTGDLARYREDGVLECLGRVDQQVKIRGYRIELGEIEAVLGQHPSVRETAVIAFAQAGDEKQLVAYVVPEAVGAAAPCELRDFLRERLPEYMVPAAFVQLEAMPLTRNGKLDRRALPEPDGQHASSETSFVAPRTPLEEVLAGIWAEVLQVDAVGVDDNFFALGGHSLVAIQAITRVRELFNMELLLRTFFESPTVAQLAVAIEADPVGREKAARIAGILARLDGLPDDELERELDSASRGAA